MSSDSFKVKKSLNVEPRTSPTLTEQGDIGFNSTSDKLQVRDSAATRSVVTEDGTQTLSNKTLSSPTLSGTVATGQTASRALATDGSGNLTASSVTSTELGYVSGVTSAIQTQLNGKISNTLTTTTGDMIYASGANTPARLGIGSSGDVLTVSGGVPAWVTPSSAPSQSYELTNLGLAVSVAANAMTIAIKQADGSSDPTAGAPVKIGFRSTTASSGAYSQATATAATSLVISSGSTLGTASGVTHYVYVYAINNSGTIELAASLSEFDEGSLQSSTAEGGAGAADSNAVLYSTTARTSKAIRLIGRITTSQATAGTWASSPTEVALAPFKPVIVTARYESDAANSIPNNSATIFNFEDKAFDSHNAVTVGASWKFTAPVPGTYLVNANNVFASGGGWAAGEQWSLILFKNGLTQIANGDYFAQAAHTANGGVHLTATVQLAAGDYIDVRVYQNSGGSLAVTGSTQNNYIDIVRVGNY